MWKRARRNSKNNNENVATEKTKLSSSAVKAMYGEMAAICMTMGMTYGVYMPLTPLWYDNYQQ